MHCCIQRHFEELRITQEWNELVKHNHTIVKEVTDEIATQVSPTHNRSLKQRGQFQTIERYSLIETVKQVRHFLCIPSNVSMFFGLFQCNKDYDPIAYVKLRGVTFVRVSLSNLFYIVYSLLHVLY